MARIGKNVLESLTRSMYADSKCVYREYIQNAADQIDAAKKIHPDYEYNVYVTIDKQNRTIIIEDNATGVKANKVQELLIDVARSDKERGVNKGFRGIGRLGGLAYCKTLRFETSYFDEDVVSTVTWDAVRLNQILDDDNDDSDAGDVIDTITKISPQKNDAIKDKHYFKVIMEEVTDDKLLNEKDVRDYLSMVAPVDYSNHFVYRSEIYKFLEKHNLHLDCYNIFVGYNQIFKDYKMTIYDPNGQEEDKVTGVEFWYEENSKCVPMYWGWYSISSLKGIISKSNNARNIRLRCENIQLGDETACYRLMPTGDKARFVRYFFGEINVLPTSKLVPNSQRDYLREDEGLKEFENNVEEKLLQLEKLCYSASDARKTDKTIRDAEKKEAEIKTKLKKGVTSDDQRQHLEKDLKKAQEDRSKACKKLSEIKQKWEDENNPLSRMFSPVGIQVPQAKMEPEKQITIASESFVYTQLRTDSEKYQKYTPQEKKLILSIYSVIEKSLNNEKEREALIDKIEEEITK